MLYFCDLHLAGILKLRFTWIFGTFDVVFGAVFEVDISVIEFRCFPSDLASFLARFCTLVKARSRYFGDRISITFRILIILASFLARFSTLLKARSLYFGDRISVVFFRFGFFFARFWTLVRARSRYFGGRISKKRLAWIRTHARLRRSFYGL